MNPFILNEAERVALDDQFIDMFWPERPLQRNHPLTQLIEDWRIEFHDNPTIKRFRDMTIRVRLANKCGLVYIGDEVFTWSPLLLHPIKYNQAEGELPATSIVSSSSNKLSSSTVINVSVNTPIGTKLDLEVPLTISVEHLQIHCLINGHDSNHIPDFNRVILCLQNQKQVLPREAALSELRVVRECLKLNKTLKLKLVVLDGGACEITKSRQSAKFDEKSVRFSLPTEKRELPAKCKRIMESIKEELNKTVRNSIVSEPTLDVFKNLKPTLERLTNLFSNIIICIGGFCSNDLQSCLGDLRLLKHQSNHWPSKKNDRNTIKEFLERINQVLVRTIHATSDLLNHTFDCMMIEARSVLPAANEANLSVRKIVPLSEYRDHLVLEVGCVFYSKLKACNDDYFVSVGLWYNGQLIGSRKQTSSSRYEADAEGIPNKFIRFDQKLQFDEINSCTLPRETIITLELKRRFHAHHTTAPTSKTSAPKIEESLGWISLSLFEEHNFSVNRNPRYFGLLPTTMHRLSFSNYHNLLDANCPYISLRLLLGAENDCVSFPKVRGRDNIMIMKFFELNQSIKQELVRILRKCNLSEFDEHERNLLWERRHYLTEFPGALPKVLRSIPNWDCLSIQDTYRLLHEWCQLSPSESIELLLPHFSDSFVRSIAVQTVKTLPVDNIELFLPQLLRAWAFDFEVCSPVVELLLYCASRSAGFANSLYWQLRHLLSINDAANFRYLLLAQALFVVCPRHVTDLFNRQTILIDRFDSMIARIRADRSCLRQQLSLLHNDLQTSLKGTRIPLDFSVAINGIISEECSVFNSMRAPLKLVFVINEDEKDRSRDATFTAMYKVGDDITQDIVTLQLISVMEQIWLYSGLDLRLFIFKCLQTGTKKGLIEIVGESETLREIHTRYGLTGSFKDCAIDQWLISKNLTESEYRSAVQNFTLSCAAYCVATFILGVGDRHNDNIMVRKSGHLFHIDFGKYLGDTEKFGTFKRDRTAFVFTSDMAYVIYEKKRSVVRYQEFVDLCCFAFNKIRHQANVLLTLLVMFQDLGVAGITREGVNFVKDILRPDETDEEASARFTCFLEKSLQNRWTQINFFIHNVAQLKANTVGQISKSDRKLSDQLSPIERVEVLDFLKWTERRSKRYFLVFQVTRQPQSKSHRSYRVYDEFHNMATQLKSRFPLIKFPMLQPKSPFSRETSNLARKRVAEVHAFCESLFSCSQEVTRSALVLEFFQQNEQDRMLDDHLSGKRIVNQPSIESSNDRQSANEYDVETQRPQLKVSFSHADGILYVLVLYARNLGSTEAANASTFVRAYLRPCPGLKCPIRETKMAGPSPNPTYHDLFMYLLTNEKVVKHNLTFNLCLAATDSTTFSIASYTSTQILLYGEMALDSVPFDGSSVTAWVPLTRKPSLIAAFNGAECSL